MGTLVEVMGRARKRPRSWPARAARLLARNVLCSEHDHQDLPQRARRAAPRRSEARLPEAPVRPPPPPPGSRRSGSRRTRAVDHVRRGHRERLARVDSRPWIAGERPASARSGAFVMARAELGRVAGGSDRSCARSSCTDLAAGDRRHRERSSSDRAAPRADRAAHRCQQIPTRTPQTDRQWAARPRACEKGGTWAVATACHIQRVTNGGGLRS